ncbi:MAG TPA: ribokinase [Rhodanobacteraceae bacterium]|nr:ribokinase [Rhodanobacteraceae bacterium]
MHAQVVVVGSYNQDHVWRVDRFPQPGETRRGSGFQTGPGGKGFNQAVACARQGVDTAFIGARGNDALGETAERTARAEGLACHWQVRDDLPTGSACIVVDGAGQNQIVVDLGANERLDAAFVAAQAPLFERARVVLLQMENNIEAIVGALQRARDGGATCVLNPAPVHAGMTVGDLALADVLVPNEGEFAQLCGRFAGIDFAADSVAGMDASTLHALARRLTTGTLVITLGSRGCFVSHGDARRGDAGEHYHVVAETVAPVDTTAAGDAFCGALAAGLVRLADRPFADAVRHANRVAALSTERRGAAATMPRFDEIAARFPS